MFGKLLKYDLKSMIKTMLPLWGLMLLIGLIIAIQMNIPIVFTNVMIMLAFMGVIIAILVVNIIIVIQRFWNGLLKEEGYLMFTLPVSARQLIFSKFISALIISIGSFIVCMLVISMLSFGIGIADGSEPTLIDIGVSFFRVYSSASEAISVMIYIVAWLMAVIYKAYAAMAIGHMSNRNRFLCAFGAYFALHILSSIVDSIAGHVGTSFIIPTILLVIQAVVYHIIVEYILTKHLNLE